MMLTTMLRGTFAIWCSSSPTSGTGSISRSSSGLDCTLPYSVFSRSACATGVDSSRREIVGDVHAADRKLRGVQQLALGEHRHAGGAAAHVDDRGAELALVVHQRGQAGGHRRRDQFLDIQIAARDAGGEACAARWRRRR